MTITVRLSNMFLKYEREKIAIGCFTAICPTYLNSKIVMGAFWQNNIIPEWVYNWGLKLKLELQLPQYRLRKKGTPSAPYPF